MIHLSIPGATVRVAIPVGEAHICGKCKVVVGADECALCGKETLTWADFLEREREAASVTATTQVVGHEARKGNGS
jgi:hypothetical protein